MSRGDEYGPSVEGPDDPAERPDRGARALAGSERPMTTAGLQAKVRLRQAWFEAHPNQPIPESRTEVERLFADIEAEAAQPSAEPPPLDVERLAVAVLAARSETPQWKGRARATEPTPWDRTMARRILAALAAALRAAQEPEGSAPDGG